MPELSAAVAGLLIAALGGAAVGLERQWSGHADGPDARFAGIRTFTMLGATGGVSGWLWTTGVTAPAAVLLAGAVAVIVVGYVAASRRSVDGTTEVAALVVLGAGLLAGLGSLRLASGIVALVTLLLVEKSRLHALVLRIDDIGLRSGVRFAVMALVVLPLLPEGPYGPLGGIKPRELWVLVLFFSGLNFAGYGARRLLGEGQGHLAAGFLGGVVSSTNVTLTFARASRTASGGGWGQAVGAVAANAVVFPRVLLTTATLASPVSWALVPYFVVPALVALGVAIAGSRHLSRDGAPAVAMANPLQLAGALQMALLFQVVLMAVHAAQDFGGSAGVFTSAALLGLTDVDALTVSMARGTSMAAPMAAAAIAVGVLANTALKLALAVTLGSRAFRVVTGGTLAVMLGLLGATLLYWRG